MPTVPLWGGKMNVRDLLKGRLFFDGAMGTMLQQCGMPSGTASGTQNHIRAENVIEIHKQYINAGANIITANTFGVHDYETIALAIDHARRAGAKLVAMDIGPTGEILEPYGDFAYEDCYKIFLQASEAGAKAGADLILIETMMDLNELKAAVTAAKTTGLPIIATMSFDQNGRTIMGASLQEMVELLESLEVDALGMNCGYGPDLYENMLEQLSTKLPILIQPNAGLPEIVGGKAIYTMTAESFAQSMAKMSVKAKLLGGCCGTTPEHIKEMIALCQY